MCDNTLVSPGRDWTQDPSLVLLDARSGPRAQARFRETHLAGARFVDLETDLSAVPEDASRGGRHPLPPIEAWTATLGRLGISPGHRVVVYDDKGGANAAARTWWMLRAIGHDAVAVLDGGMQAALAAGHPTESGAAPAPAEPVTPYPADAYHWPTVTYDEVKGLAQGRLLVDVRAAERYRGEVEPIDPVAGHLPGATNHPLQNHLGGDARFLAPEALRAQMNTLLAGRRSGDAIYSCGSGVTACHGILAMVHAGFDVPALYVGSWSEWCRRAP